MKNFLSFSLFLFLSYLGYGQHVSCPKEGVFFPSMPKCNKGNYYLVFEDNFDGNSLDLSKWFPETGVIRDPFFKDQKAWHLPENIEVSNGTLKIIAKKPTNPIIGKVVTSWEPYIFKIDTFDYTTGEIYSNQKFYYGKYEARCRMPKGKGFWPAFWTFGGPGWNEIDFFEVTGDNINKFTCCIHHAPGGNIDNHVDCPFELDNAGDFSQWHVFTCIFDFDKIVWQIDGNTVRTLHRFMTISGQVVSCGEDIGAGVYFMQSSYPLQSMHIRLNLAIQSRKNAPNANTVFPSVFEIDYVRYYIKSEQPPDCLAHVIYNNTNKLPSVTRASNYIQAGNNVTVQSGQNVTFKAPTVTLLPGFTAQFGSTFSAIPEGCTFQNNKSEFTDFFERDTTYLSQLIRNSKSDTTFSYQEKIYKEEIENKVNNAFNKKFHIFPNPTNEALNVIYSVSNNSFICFVIRDIYGKELFRKQIQGSVGTNTSIIDVSRLSNGLYILIIITNDEKREKKFIISK